MKNGFYTFELFLYLQLKCVTKKLIIMLRYFVLLIIVASFLTACNNESANDETTNTDTLVVDQDTTSAVAIADFDNYAKDHAGEMVKVEGLVSHVCHESFDKMYLTDKRNEYTVEIQANEELKFDTLLQDKTVMVKGEINELVIDSAYLADWEAEVKANADTTEEKEAVEVEEGDEHHAANPLEQIESYRVQIEKRGEPLRFYSIIAKSFEEVEK